jgi:hypothetical protein
MLKALIVLHRYTGVLVGLLMTLWCLSGFVMMYQSFPELTPAERLHGLAPLSLADCCALERLPIPGDAPVSEARVEMAAGVPVLHLNLKGEKPAVFDLATAQPREGFTEAETLAIAQTFARQAGIKGSARTLGVIAVDQWTVPTARRNGPVHKFAFDDPARTEIYVSGTSGEVFQDTTARERALSWVGAIPHWLYPTALRQNPPAWTQVVIWTSTVGVFLTLTGLIVGLLRIGGGRKGSLSPYKGVWFWHHMTGLVFGILTLTWVASGLLTMNPWGLLESNAVGLRGKLVGTAPWSRVRAALERSPTGTSVQLTNIPLAGEPRVIAVDAEGRARRFDALGAPSSPDRAELSAAFERAGQKLAELELIGGEDAYYYAHHSAAPLPVWRAILAGPKASRVYIDAQSGRIVRVIDDGARGARWFSSAFHDFDWPVLRRRPIWDLIVLPLLLGVTAVCGIGVWLGLSRIARDFSALRSLWRRRRRRGDAQTV